MGLQPSASNTFLLLGCPRPFDPGLMLDLEEADNSSNEPRRYGSGAHQVIATVIRHAAFNKKAADKFFASSAYATAIDEATTHYGVRGTAPEMTGHVKSTYGTLRNWAENEGYGALTTKEILVEKSYAIATRGKGGARVIGPPTEEDHAYEAMRPGEIPGTVDLKLVPHEARLPIVFLDHKFGSVDHGFALPAKLPQLRTLGLASEGPAEAKRAKVVGIVHADRRGLPVVYADPIEARDLAAHRKVLGAALERVGDGSLRAGSWCTHCPARIGCPAHADNLVGDAAAAIVAAGGVLLRPEASAGLSKVEKAARLYVLRKQLEPLLKAADAETRELVRAGEIIEIPGKGVLTMRKEEYETLSKTSVVEALGKLEGEKELERLRRRGVIKKATREKMVPIL